MPIISQLPIIHIEMMTKNAQRSGKYAARRRGLEFNFLFEFAEIFNQA